MFPLQCNLLWILQSAVRRPVGFHSVSGAEQSLKWEVPVRRCRWPPPRPDAALPEEETVYAASPLQSSQSRSSARRGLWWRRRQVWSCGTKHWVAEAAGQRAELPVCRAEGLIWPVGSEVQGAFSCASSSLSCTAGNWPSSFSSFSQAELSCNSKHGARRSFLPVEKKMTDSLCGVWGKSGRVASSCCSSLLQISSTLVVESLLGWSAEGRRFPPCSSSWSSNNLWTTSCPETKVIVQMIDT